MSDLAQRAAVAGDALAALSAGALGEDAPETRALRWLTHHALRGDLRAAVAELDLTVEEGPGIGYRLYEAVRDHYKASEETV